MTASTAFSEIGTNSARPSIGIPCLFKTKLTKKSFIVPKTTTILLQQKSTDLSIQQKRSFTMFKE